MTTRQFCVHTREMVLLDEDAFRAAGGDTLHFDEVDVACCRLTATGSRAAVDGVAMGIREHHTASR